MCPISNGIFLYQSATKVLLDPSTDIILWSIMDATLWSCKNCLKIGKTQQGVVWEAKHKPCMFGIIIPSWLSNM